MLKKDLRFGEARELELMTRPEMALAFPGQTQLMSQHLLITSFLPVGVFQSLTYALSLNIKAWEQGVGGGWDETWYLQYVLSHIHIL